MGRKFAIFRPKWSLFKWEMGRKFAICRPKWSLFKWEMGREIAIFRSKWSLFKWEMGRRIAPKTFIFQIVNRIPAAMIHFQIVNGPQDRCFLSKNIDFQIGNERLQTCEHLFKIDHRNFQMCHFEMGFLKKKLSKC